MVAISDWLATMVKHRVRLMDTHTGLALVSLACSMILCNYFISSSFASFGSWVFVAEHGEEDREDMIMRFARMIAGTHTVDPISNISKAFKESGAKDMMAFVQLLRQQELKEQEAAALVRRVVCFVPSRLVCSFVLVVGRAEPLLQASQASLCAPTSCLSGSCPIATSSLAIASTTRSAVICLFVVVIF